MKFEGQGYYWRELLSCLVCGNTCSDFKSFLDLLIYFMCICMYVPCTLRGEKRTSDPLEMELQVVMSHHVSGGS